MLIPTPIIVRRRAFTMVEIMVVVAIIGVLLAILGTALVGAKAVAKMADSQNRMRQIAVFMNQYSSDNREFVLPSQFDYSSSAFKGRVRSDSSLLPSEIHQGTWADILWTENRMGLFPDGLDPAEGLIYDYESDSPDRLVYEKRPSYDENILRAAEFNKREASSGDGEPLPFGSGAKEGGLPGFFAANNFFQAPPANTAPPTTLRWYTRGQIKAPDRSMYLVDSWAGETIDPVDAAYDNITSTPPTIEVDFRYGEVCLMLFMDGHMDPINPWDDLDNLEDDRHIRIRNLTK